MLPYKIIISGANDADGEEIVLEKSEQEMSLDELIDHKRQIGKEETEREKQQQIKNLKDILR